MLDILTLPVSPFSQNCRLLIHDEKRTAVVVDPGGNANLIVSALEQNEAQPVAIVLTHIHLDHVAAVGALLKKYPSLPIYGPQQADALLLSTLDQQSAAFGFAHTGSFTPQYVTDGQVLQIFPDASFKVLYTPGHTPGGVCYYCQEETFVLTGDTLFAGSIGRTDFPGGSFDDLIASIKSKLLTLPDETEVFSGHGPDSTIGEEKKSNPFL